MKSLVYFALLSVCNIVAGFNYCSISNSHIGCRNNGGFGSKCPAEKSMVEMTPELKSMILDSHNTKRNQIAAGKLPGYKPASRMATMIWNDELAKLASFNVKRCIYGHDSNRNTKQFKYSGQNLAIKWWFGTSFSDSSIISEHIDAWWSEYKDASMADINKYPVNSRKKIGHFTVMAADKNVAVGCAAIKFKDRNQNNWDSLTLACNYATTNLQRKPIYVAGKTGSKCSKKMNINYPALCSKSEVYRLT